MKIWIIGGTSVAAIHAARHFSKAGYSVLSTTRVEFDKRLWPFSKVDLEKIQFKLYNCHSEVSETDKILDDFKPDFVVNFLSMGMVDQSWQKPADWFRTNIIDLEKLLSALVKRKNVRYLHFSTPEVYGNCATELTENWHFMPSSPYALSRATGDHLVRLYGEQYGLNYSITRASSLYGEGQRLYRLIPKACVAAIQNQCFEVQGDGLSVRDYVHAEDVARALLLVANHAEPMTVFHIGCKVYFSVNDILEKICSRSQLDYKKFVGHTEARKSIDFIYRLNCDAVRLLGWEPEIKFDDGLDRVWSWAKTNHHLFDKCEHSYQHVP